jgi:YbgC/YbaW family acyl-CoA thioester hydrolase
VERFTLPVTVRWSDCDANGHVRNTAYSEYAIEVRMAYLSTHGFGFAEMKAHQIGPVILREEIDYLREGQMGETLTVDFTALGLSPDGTRFKMGHELVKPNGKVAARLVVHGGWMDLAARRLAPPPAPLKAILDGVPRSPAFEVLDERPARTSGPKGERVHRSRLVAMVIDCEGPDVDAAARFWSGALGRPVKPVEADAGRYRELAATSDEPMILVQGVDRADHPGRVHLDIETDDQEAEVRRLEALGAKRVGFVKRWWVLEAPTGQRFCVVHPQRGPIEGHFNRWSDGPATS